MLNNNKQQQQQIITMKIATKGTNYLVPWINV